MLPITYSPKDNYEKPLRKTEVITSCRLSLLLALFPKCGCQYQSLVNISEFNDFKNIFSESLNDNSEGSLHRTENDVRYCNFGFFLPKLCYSHENSDSIFTDPENPTIQAKNFSIICTELKSAQFRLIFVYIWLLWQLPVLH